MKVIAAYLLAILGGKTTPSAEDLKDILGSGTHHLHFSYNFGLPFKFVGFLCSVCF